MISSFAWILLDRTMLGTAMNVPRPPPHATIDQTDDYAYGKCVDVDRRHAPQPAHHMPPRRQFHFPKGTPVLALSWVEGHAHSRARAGRQLHFREAHEVLQRRHEAGHRGARGVDLSKKGQQGGGTACQGRHGAQAHGRTGGERARTRPRVLNTIDHSEPLHRTCAEVGCWAAGVARGVPPPPGRGGHSPARPPRPRRNRCS